MDKINWKQKLTSRKFWAAVAGVVTTLMVIFNIDAVTQEQVIALLGALSVLIAYILGEGLVDYSRNNQEVANDDHKNVQQESNW